MSLSSNRQWLIIGFFAFGVLLIHMLVSTNYELHRDAYLYLAEADHLAWGYMSIPPFTAFVGHFWTLLFGYSSFAVRLMPAFTGAFCIILIGLIVRDLGGNNWSILMACLAYVVSPAFLRVNSLFQPVSFNIFFWLLGIWGMVRLLRTEDRRWWLVLGVIFGIGFLNKYSILFPAVAFIAGLLLTPQRKLLRSVWVVYGLIAGLIIMSPNLVWEYGHNFPVVHHMLELHNTQLVHVRIFDFIIMQGFMILPALPVFLAGLYYTLIDRSASRFRAIGWLYIILMALMIVLSGKAYYTLGVYPAFFAFGGVAVSRYGGGNFKWIRYALTGFMILVILPVLPMSLPLLRYPSMIRYDRVISGMGMNDLLRWEDGKVHALPQDYADMTGWSEIASIVDSTWNALPADEKKTTGIYAEQYAEAGAIHYFDRNKKMPGVISFNDSFLLWAPDSVRGSTLIYVNDDTSGIRKLFKDITLEGTLNNPYARDHGMQVYLCRKPVAGFGQYYADKVKRLRSAYKRKS